MKIDEIKKRINSLNAVATELTEQFTQTYGDEIPAEPAELSEGLRFKTDTDHFTEEERAVNEKLLLTVADSLRANTLISNELDAELKKLMKAQQNREQYVDTFDKDIDIAPLHQEVEETLQQAEAITKSLKGLSKALQNIACNRYFDNITYRGKGGKNNKYRATLAEVEDIGNGADRITTDGDNIRTGGFVIFNERGRSSAEDNSYVEKLYQFFDAIQAVNLMCYYSTAYYEFHFSTILPTGYKDITADKQKDLIRETIEPCFKSHLEAIRALKMPTGEAESIITRAVESVYNQLNLTLRGDEADSLIVRSRPVLRLDYPMTPITRELYSGNFSPVTDKPVYMFSKGNNNRPVYIYYSTSLADVEGVTGAEDLTLEEEGICNAIYSQWKAGNRYVTNQMIKNTRRGGEGKSKTRITDKEDNRYTRFIEGAEYIKIKIDQREYAEERKIPHKQIEDSLLDVAKAYNVNLNGTIVEWCWYIKQAPIINVHAEMIGQSLSLPMQIANVDVRAEFYPLRDYLIQEIYRIKSDRLNTETPAEKALREEAEQRKQAEAIANGKTYKPKKRKQHPIILFETIYERLYDSPDLRTKKTIQKETLKMLEHWKKQGWIKDYKPQVEGVNRKSSTKSRSNKSYTLLDAVKIDVTASELLE